MREPSLDAEDPRDALAALGRRFYGRGWMLGTAGNLSARVADGTLWVTASGVDKGALTVGDFVRVTVEGQTVEAPPGKRPSAETCLHQAVYGWDDTQRACLHVHTIAANLLTRIWPGDLPLPPIEMVKGLGVWDEDPRLVAQGYENPAHVPAIGEAVAARLPVDPPDVPVYLVRDHGITVWGTTLREAANRVECATYLFDYMLQAVQADAVWWTDRP